MVPRHALLLLLAASALSLVAAQEIKLVAGPGCADLPPTPPTALRATPGDASVLLTWDRPANGACVTEYQVTVLPVDPTKRSAAPSQQRTAQFNLTISALSNNERPALQHQYPL